MSDTGIGIPEEEMVHLGRRFHRVQTPGGRSYEGTGIGTHLLSFVSPLSRMRVRVRNTHDAHKPG